MEFVGGDADLGAEAVLVTVSEARARVPEDAGTVHFAEEFVGGGFVARDDGVAVRGTVLGDVIDCLLDVFDNAHGEYEFEVFGVPIVLGCELRARDELTRAFIAAEFDFFLGECLRDAREESIGDFFVDEQCLDGIADVLQTLAFGVDDNFFRGG